MCQHARGGGGTRRGRCEISNIRLRHGETVTTAERGREFWRGVLLAGGFTVLPRCTLEPVPGVGEHEARIPDELGAADRPCQGAWRGIGRARGLDRLRRHGGPPTVALPDDDRTTLLAGDAAG